MFLNKKTNLLFMFTKINGQYMIRQVIDHHPYIISVDIEEGVIMLKTHPGGYILPIGIESSLKTTIYEKNQELYNQLFNKKLNKRGLDSLLKPLVN